MLRRLLQPGCLPQRSPEGSDALFQNMLFHAVFSGFGACVSVGVPHIVPGAAAGVAAGAAAGGAGFCHHTGARHSFFGSIVVMGGLSQWGQRMHGMSVCQFMGPGAVGTRLFMYSASHF